MTVRWTFPAAWLAMVIAVAGCADNNALTDRTDAAPDSDLFSASTQDVQDVTAASDDAARTTHTAASRSAPNTPATPTIDRLARTVARVPTENSVTAPTERLPQTPRPEDVRSRIDPGPGELADTQCPLRSEGPPYTCTTCTIGAACDVGNRCRRGIVTSCSGDRPVCTDVGPVPAGVSCGTGGQVCDGMGNCTCPAGQSDCGGVCRPTGNPCTVGVGACARTGTIVCSGTGTTCSATPGTPSPETCNGMDDDCNGIIDDITSMSCSPAPCRRGSTYCSSGTLRCSYTSNDPAGTPCTMPTGGVCDGAGNCVCPSGQSNCSGVCQPTGAPCTVGVGACARTGTIVCSGTGTACSATPGTPSPETCNGMDDDCNGVVDDIPSTPCTVGVGACARTGTLVCSGSGGGGSYGPFTGSGSGGGSGARCLATYSFPVVAGQTYTISTCGSYSGDPYLVVTGACSCSNDDYCGLGSQCTCTATSTGTATICASTWSGASATWSYRVTYGSTGTCAGPFTGSGSGGGSGARCLATYSFPVVAGQTYTISTCGSYSGDPYLVVTGACLCSNDDYCGLGSQCTCTATSTGTATICASTWSGASATWSYRVTSTACSGTTCSATPGTPTAEVCDGIDNDCDGLIDEGNVCITNDLCTSATPVSLGAPGTVTTVSGSTVGARHDMTGSCGATWSSPDVFYRFTLTQRELVYVDAFGSGYDIVLFLSNACGATQPGGFACNDDACGTLQSQIVQVLDPGTYYLAVSGWAGRSGSFTLRFQHLPASRDVFNLPRGFGQTVTGNTSGSPNSISSCPGWGPDQTWYFVTCPGYAGGSFWAQTCWRAGWDTVLQYREGNSTASYCNDDWCGLQSYISGRVSPGAGLHALYIDGYSWWSAGPYSIYYSMP